MWSRTAATIGAAASLWLYAATAQAQLRLDITEGVRDAVPIAIVPFGGQVEGASTDVAAVVANDLLLSGRFKPLERRDMVTRPTTGAAIRFEDWRLLRSDFIVVGRVEPDAAGIAVTFELFNVQIPVNRFWMAGIVVAIGLVLAGLFRWTRFGLATRAAAEDEVAGMLAGLSPNQLSLANTMIASADVSSQDIQVNHV